MHFRVSHMTRYDYAEPVSLCHSLLHIKPPRQNPRQRCVASQIRVDPCPAVNREHEDFFGNRVNYFSIQQAHTTLEVTCVSEVDVIAPDLAVLADSLPWEIALERLHERREAAMARARIYTLPSPLAPLDPAAMELAAMSFPPGRPILEGASDLMGRIYREFEYDPHFTTVATPVAEVMGHRRGSSSRAPMPRTPGSRSWCRTWAGSTSTPPTTWSPASSTSSPPWAGTSRMSPPCAGSSMAAGATI
jgi:transglutaminase-like putative cysteine protease